MFLISSLIADRDKIQRIFHRPLNYKVLPASLKTIYVSQIR